MRFALLEIDLAPAARAVVDELAARAAKAADGSWLPACGGTEVPFTTRTGRRLHYLWQPTTGRHAYLDCGADLILSDDDAREALAV